MEDDDHSSLKHQTIVRAAHALCTAGGRVFISRVLGLPHDCTVGHALTALGGPVPDNCRELLERCGLDERSVSDVLELVVVARTLRFIAQWRGKVDTVCVDGDSLLTFVASKGFVLSTLELLEAGGCGEEALKRVTEHCVACCHETSVFSCPHAELRAVLCVTSKAVAQPRARTRRRRPRRAARR